MTDIDLPLAAEILARLGDPPLLRADRSERSERSSNGHGEESAHLDAALSDALMRLRYTVNRQTFEFLRWKVLAARETARQTVLRSREFHARRAVEAATTVWFQSADGETWGVTESSIPRDDSGPRTCLLFASESAIRRVWTYPPNWRELGEDELEALSWMR